MDIRVLGRSFNYVVAPEIYYTQVLVWIFNVTFCISFQRSVLARADSYSLYSKHLTRTQFCTRTNITHIVISLSLCKYTLSPNVTIIYLCNQYVFVRQELSSHNVYGISKRDNISSRERNMKTHKNYYCS